MAKDSHCNPRYPLNKWQTARYPLNKWQTARCPRYLFPGSQPQPEDCRNLLCKVDSMLDTVGKASTVKALAYCRIHKILHQTAHLMMKGT